MVMVVMNKVDINISEKHLTKLLFIMNVKLVKNIQYFDVLRSDRSVSSSRRVLRHGHHF